jgi:hypothetical protein
MAVSWYKWRRRSVRYTFIGFLLYLTFLVFEAFTATSTRLSSSERHYIVEQTEQAVMARLGTMKNSLFALASAILVSCQNSTGTGTPTTDGGATATGDGVTTAFSIAFTVPASADVGPNLLPTVKDPKAVRAQDVCPGYLAEVIEKRADGFTAILRLAGEAVSAALAMDIMDPFPAASFDQFECFALEDQMMMMKIC